MTISITITDNVNGSVDVEVEGYKDDETTAAQQIAGFLCRGIEVYMQTYGMTPEQARAYLDQRSTPVTVN